MIILATSDLHGNLPIINDAFDLFLIVGDICPAHDHYYTFQREWVTDVFVDYINSLPFKDENSRVILTWGNHDAFGERGSMTEFKEIEENTNGRLKILRHSLYEHEVIVSDNPDTIQIFGTPYCTIFGHWPFMVSDETIDKKFSAIPENIDILISHDSPYLNNLGAITEGNRINYNTGNRILAKHINRIKPKIFLSGHFHSGNHNFECVDDVWMANVSLVNESYAPVNKILKINYDEENRRVSDFDYIAPFFQYV